MRHFIPIALVVLLNAAPAAATADEVEHELIVQAGSHFLLVKDSAFDVFSSNDWLVIGSFAVEFELFDDLFVAAGLAGANQESWLWSRHQTAFGYTEPQLGVRKGFEVAPGVRPYVGAWGTYAWTDATVKLWEDRELSYEDGWLDGRFGGKAVAGCELYLPREVFEESGFQGGLFEYFTMGVSLEAGYAYKPAVDLAVLEAPDSEKGLQTAAPDMGDLGLQGFYMALDMRFYF